MGDDNGNGCFASGGDNPGSARLLGFTLLFCFQACIKSRLAYVRLIDSSCTLSKEVYSDVFVVLIVSKELERLFFNFTNQLFFLCFRASGELGVFYHK